MTSKNHKFLILLVVYAGIFSEVHSLLASQARRKRSFIDEETIHLRNYKSGPAECTFMKLDEGVYKYRSDGSEHVCGLYILAEPNAVIEFTYRYMDVSCSQGSQLEFVDGWELNGQMFPSAEEGLMPVQNRVSSYCRHKKSKRRHVSSQNVGLIRFQMLEPGEGFDIEVRFLKNPTPCNVLLAEPSGVYTISNHGRQMNCSVVVMAPVTFEVLGNAKHLSVCQSAMDIQQNSIFDISTKRSFLKNFRSRSFGYLNKISDRDCVEFRGGNSLDPLEMQVVPFSGSNGARIACQNSVIRLISNGYQTNYIQFEINMLLEFDRTDLFCPSLIESLGL